MVRCQVQLREKLSDLTINTELERFHSLAQCWHMDWAALEAKALGARIVISHYVMVLGVVRLRYSLWSYDVLPIV